MDLDFGVLSIVIVQVIVTVMHKNLFSTPLINRCFTTKLLFYDTEAPLSSSSDFCAVCILMNYSFTPLFYRLETFVFYYSTLFHSTHRRGGLL